MVDTPGRCTDWRPDRVVAISSGPRPAPPRPAQPASPSGLPCVLARLPEPPPTASQQPRASSVARRVLAMKVNYILGLGIVLGVIGSTFLVAFGILYVKPYVKVRTMVQTTCTTMREGVGDDVRCICSDDAGSTCMSRYPCYKLWTNFTAEGGEEVQNVTLYDSYETFILQKDVLQCSYHKCSQSEKQNFESVRAFAQEYGSPGRTYSCYYEPTDTSYAIMEVVTKDTVIHCMLWPSLAVVAGFVILLVYLNHPSQTQHHGFNSLERPWARQQTRYECIIDPNESAAQAASGHTRSQSIQDLATTPTAQLV